jgi:hypothetical protein
MMMSWLNWSITIILFVKLSHHAYRRARKDPLPWRIAVPWGLLSILLSTHIISYIYKGGFSRLENIPEFIAALNIISFYIFISFGYFLGKLNYPGGEYISICILLILWFFNRTLFSKLTAKSADSLQKNFEHSTARNIKPSSFFKDWAMEKIFGKKRKILLRPDLCIFISIMEGALIGLGALLIYKSFQIQSAWFSYPGWSTLTVFILVGPWAFMIEFVALFSPNRKAVAKLVQQTNDFPISKQYLKGKDDLEALYQRYISQTPHNPAPVFFRSRRESGAYPASSREPEALRILRPTTDTLLSEQMNRRLAAVLLRSVREQLAMGRTVVVVAPEPWLGSLERWARRAKTVTDAPLLIMADGCGAVQGSPKSVLTGFGSLEALADLWPRLSPALIQGVDLMVVIGAEQAGGDFRCGFSRLLHAMGRRPEVLLVQAEARDQSEAAVRDLLLIDGPLEEKNVFTEADRLPDYLLLWEDDPAGPTASFDNSGKARPVDAVADKDKAENELPEDVAPGKDEPPGERNKGENTESDPDD